MEKNQPVKWRAAAVDKAEAIRYNLPSKSPIDRDFHMTIQSLQANSLVLYKNRPARVLQLGKKVTIGLESGESIQVREKDVTLLHPGPLNDLHSLRPLSGDVHTAWELLTGEPTTLADVAELTYGEFSPAAAWAAWQLVDDGLYYEGSPEEILAHTPEQVQAERERRAAKEAEQQAWTDFVARAEEKALSDADGRYLQEVAALANGQQESSQVMKALGQSETPAGAHAWLLDHGVWTPADNPYPLRHQVNLHPPASPLPPLPDSERRDLTHLVALAIDDEGNQDPDDAVSLDGEWLWVHVADAAALIPPDSSADRDARERGATLYLPEGTIPMLPAAAVPTLGLGLNEVSPALSIGLKLGPDGAIEERDVVPSWVRVTRLTYREAQAQLDQEPFAALNRLAQIRRQRRLDHGAVEIDLPEVKISVDDGRVSLHPIPSLPSRTLVTEAMLAAGEGVAQFAAEHQLAVPFAHQDPPAERVEDEGMAASFAQRRMMRPGQHSVNPAPHVGLGLDAYCQATSPLRRYLDLVVHQQLRAYLAGRELLDEQEIVARMGMATTASQDTRRAERFSRRHWALVYLIQNPSWQGETVAVEENHGRVHLIIPELDLETDVYLRNPPPLNSVVRLTVSEIRLADLDASFRVL